MLSSGFTNAPVSRFLVTYLVLASVLATLTDTKYYFYIQVVPHLWWYRQIWRVLIWQACYTNSTEVLFSALTLYHLRVIERLWGSRRFASFLLSTLLITTFLVPVLLALLIRPLTLNQVNYLPAGPTPLVFAILAQYHAAIPRIYKYRVATTLTGPSSSSSAGGQADVRGITLSDKSLTYVLPLQLAMAQLPMSAVSAGVGWLVGYAYRYDVLPEAIRRWRIPGWVWGDRRLAQRGGVDALGRG